LPNNSVKILITGSTGLLGQALDRHLASGHEVTGLSRHAPSNAPEGRHVVCDLGDGRRTTEVVAAIRPEVVIHTQALSDVDRCEREPDAARSQNIDATAHLIQALEQAGDPSGQGMRPSLLVYVSTDYVFDGTNSTPYREDDEPRPISVYGRSKLEAERLALGYPRGVVVRPSTLFGPGRMNFCDHIVSRLKAGQPVEAFVDQVTSPTYTEDLSVGLGELCAAVRGLPDGARPRIVHLANAGECSRVAFAERVADLLGLPRDLIQRVPMAAQRRPARRPAYSALATTHGPSLIGRTLRPWDDALQAYLHQRGWLN